MGALNLSTPSKCALSAAQTIAYAYLQLHPLATVNAVTAVL